MTYSFRENLKDSKVDGSVLSERYMYHGIPVISFGYERVGEDVHYKVDNEGLARWAERLLSEEKPDIIHAGHLMRVFDILKIAKTYRVPYIVTLTDFWAICFRGILIDPKLNLCTGPRDGEACVRSCPDLPNEVVYSRLKATREILTGAEAVCSPTRFLASIYMNEIPALNIRVIPLGLKTDRAILEKKRSLKSDSLTLMYGGTWLPHKGLDLLLRVFSQVQSEKTVLKIYGAGPNKEYNELIRKSAEQDGRIQIKGVFRECDIEAIFSDVDCSIIPSIWWENSPYMLIESLVRNVPVIATDVDGLTEFVKDGFNGFTFRIGNASHLKEVIERIVRDPSILNRLKENLSTVVWQTVEESAYAYERLYLHAGSKAMIEDEIGK